MHVFIPKMLLWQDSASQISLSNFENRLMAGRKEERTRGSAIAEKPRRRVRYSLRQKWKTIFYGHYRFSFNHCDIISLQSYRFW